MNSKMILDLEEILTVGEGVFFESGSPTLPFAIVFEDDTVTGYFYAVERKDNLIILDALHIYNVNDVIDKHKPSKVQIVWTVDGNIATLLINNYCHAIFDFVRKAGYCRNGFPESNRDWIAIKD